MAGERTEVACGKRISQEEARGLRRQEVGQQYGDTSGPAALDVHREGPIPGLDGETKDMR